MAEDKTNRTSCGREIRRLTAERRNGMCAPCFRESERPPEVVFADRVFTVIDSIIEPFTDYRSALRDLQALPRGYALCFAFHHVHSDVLNGGISQLYANSTWALILEAENAASQAGVSSVSTLLREIVYYYHLKGRSKHKRNLADDYFSALPLDWAKSLQQLDDEYFNIECDASSVILSLCRDHQELFAEP